MRLREVGVGKVLSRRGNGVNEDRPAAIMLMGATATGKSRIAEELSEHLPCEIVSVDSALVYRGMDIGTAKPSAEVRARVPHHLIDICDPSTSYSAARFRDDARAAIDAILARGRVPLLVGGTMLYFRTLLRGLSDMPAADPGLRAELEQEALKHGWGELHRRLALVDPEAARRIHPNDPQRIQRAIEVYRLSGRPLTELQRSVADGALPVRPLPIEIRFENRELLHRRIAARFQEMMQLGFLEEVARLRAHDDLHSEVPAMRAVGYRQLWGHLDGLYTLQDAVYKGIYATRQLAKRQLTWMRSERPATTFEAGDPRIAIKILKFLEGNSI